MLSERRIKRFWAMVDRSAGPRSCWPWRGKVERNGYAKTLLSGHKHWLCHRLAWVIAFGEIPEGLCVLHHCDNRRCCNPSHFFLGDRADNAADCVEKGRSLRGERNHAAKLTPEQILEIRALRDVDTQQDLADRYGVTQAIISKIQLGRLWRHVGAPVEDAMPPRACPA